ncbi:hypothetical protein VSDG_07275 [Cytospora chrysosperma]|uniref:Heterokaryon incompatibility domain-containing protein n=1 Tax=Cytospora chrysosperma TaxID=252740 RepID=A0A423VMP9_CYTCH|nr:hypothetical protein VSDG_07275 [Valsa sordida]
MATQVEGNVGSTRHLQYKKLSGDPSRPEIRLLEVRPAQSLHDTVSARIVNLPLTPDLDFIGVSALYGDTDDTEPIIIDGKRIMVPANLGQALRHARAVFWPLQTGPTTADPKRTTVDGKGQGQRGMESNRKRPHWLRHLLRTFGLPSSEGDRSRAQNSTLRIWIDVFCVNERDEREQKEQHTLMATAYRHARTVVGWLGPKDETSDKAVQIIRDVDRAVPANFGTPEDRQLHPEHYAPHHVWIKDIQYLWQLPEGVKDLRECEVWITMSKFLGRQYFQRDWILNEIAMASFPTFLIGEEILSWSEVLRWNRCNEELSDTGAGQFPEEYRTEICSLLPLATVYTMLKAFERSKDNRPTDSSSRSVITRCPSSYSSQ